MSTPGGYHEYTGGFWYEWEKATTKFQGFLFSHLLRLCSCYVGLRNTRQLAKIPLSPELRP